MVMVHIIFKNNLENTITFVKHYLLLYVTVTKLLQFLVIKTTFYKDFVGFLDLAISDLN